MLIELCGCSFRGDQSSRPPHVASQMGALAWGLDMANFENVPVALNGFEMAEVSMLWSVFMREVWLRIQVGALSSALPLLRHLDACTAAAWHRHPCSESTAQPHMMPGAAHTQQARLQAPCKPGPVFAHSAAKPSCCRQGQLLGVAISFLRNFGVLSGVSGALSVLSAGVGSLAGDQQAQKERQEARQDRQITGLGQGLLEGGQAAGKGFFRGLTGIATRPVQGFKQGGLAGGWLASLLLWGVQEAQCSDIPGSTWSPAGSQVWFRGPGAGASVHATGM